VRVNFELCGGIGELCGGNDDLCAYIGHLVRVEIELCGRNDELCT
jgi:hypothetical protein